MATELIVNGPVKIPYRCMSKTGFVKCIDKEEKQEFLRDLDRRELSKKQGCYIFAIRAGRGFTPWYVGLTKKSLRNECMSTHCQNHYNIVLSKGRKGRPYLFFITPDGNKCKVARNVLREMEIWLIHNGHSKNNEMRNIHNKPRPKWSIRGVIGSGKGKPSGEAKTLTTMMGISVK